MGNTRVLPLFYVAREGNRHIAMWVGPLDDPAHCLLITFAPCTKNIVGLGIHILMPGNIHHHKSRLLDIGVVESEIYLYSLVLNCHQL